MKKKYLSLNPNIKEAEEFVIKAEKGEFTISKVNSISDVLKIPYSDFNYPEFQVLEKFEEEINSKICKAFGIDGSKLILLQYDQMVEDKINQMRVANCILFAF